MKLFGRNKKPKTPTFFIDVWPDAVVDSQEVRFGVTTRIGKQGWGWVAIRTEPYCLDCGEADTKDEALKAAQLALASLRVRA